MKIRNNFNRPKGTQDIFLDKAQFFSELTSSIEKLFKSYSFKPIFFPSYEYEALFRSTLSESSDLINKEMFIFDDRKGRKMALRPEGTISTARVVLQNKLFLEQMPLKFYYFANMFRYEQPQKNRHREFWQAGVELIGNSSFVIDFLLLKMSTEIFSEIKINNFSLQINYLGGTETQENYKKILRSEFINREKEFCNNCQKKFINNILRILDCKFCQKNFSFPDYNKAWNKDDFFYVKELEKLLVLNSIKFTYNYNLVRGLDYYNGLIWEVYLEGNDKALIGGGRYDGLFEKLGNVKLPASGFALGVNRLLEYCFEKKISLSEKKTKIFFFVEKKEYYKQLILWQKELYSKDIELEYNLTSERIEKLIKNKGFELLASFKDEKILINDLLKRDHCLLDPKQFIDYLIKFKEKVKLI